MPLALLGDDRNWLLVTGCWSLVAGHWSLVAGYWLLVTGCWLLVAGYWLLGDASNSKLQDRICVRHSGFYKLHAFYTCEDNIQYGILGFHLISDFREDTQQLATSNK